MLFTSTLRHTADLLKTTGVVGDAMIASLLIQAADRIEQQNKTIIDLDEALQARDA